MTAEKFITAWIKSEILTPKKLTFKPTNLYYEDLKNKITKQLVDLVDYVETEIEDAA